MLCGPICPAVFASPIGASNLWLPLGEGAAQPFYLSFKGSSSGQCLLVGFSHISQTLFYQGFLPSMNSTLQGSGVLRLGPCSGTGGPALSPSLMAFKRGHHLLHQLRYPRWGSWQPLLFVNFQVKGEVSSLVVSGLMSWMADKSASGSNLGRPSQQPQQTVCSVSFCPLLAACLNISYIMARQ